MKVYNIYSKNEKINSNPLSMEDVKNILSKDFIIKQIDEHTSQKIYVKDLKIIKCTLI